MHSYMVQFPLRPSYRPMPNAPRTARIKPENNILQLDYDVDQRSEHFDKDAEDYLKQKYLRLQSSSVPALTNYVVGVFRQGQLHLTPVTSVLQMRPSLAHIDDAVDEEEDDDMDVTMEQEQKEAAAEVKEVQFQFKKKQSERAISAIQSSYAFKKQQINAEQWRELDVMDKSVRCDGSNDHRVRRSLAIRGSCGHLYVCVVGDRAQQQTRSSSTCSASATKSSRPR